MAAARGSVLHHDVGSSVGPPWCCEIAGLSRTCGIGLIHNTSCSTHTSSSDRLLAGVFWISDGHTDNSNKLGFSYRWF